jgi:plastocyanin
MPRYLLSLALLAAVPGAVLAQGSLDRSPNVSGDWVVRPGTVQFNFLHRFVRSPGPVRKVSNFPTFLLATSVLRGTSLGFNYASNSTLSPAYPNEWEFFARALPLTQGRGFPLDVGGQVGWNLAADGLDGEVSLGRRIGPARFTAVGRALSDPYTRNGKAQLAYGGGAAVKLTRHVALHGDLVTLANRSAARGEKTAWSAGFAVAIPNTPHTLSIHASNTNTATLQGASRGAKQVRYGFEFTIPVTLARYFGRKPAPAAVAPGPAAEAPGHIADPAATGPRFRSTMTGLKFAHESIEIAVGTTIEWKNDDPVPHTVTADDNSFDSGLIDGGQVWRYTFTRPGSYPIHCTPHPFMTATIVVK